MRSKISSARTCDHGRPSRGSRSVKIAVRSHGLHEFLGRADGDVEILDRAPIALQSMNSKMSGWSTRSTAMFAPRRAPPCLIVSVATSKMRMNETGPGRDAAGRLHDGSRRAQPAEAEARPAARLVDLGRRLERVEDPFERVVHRDDEASGELALGPAGVHERRRVRHETPGRHHLKKVRLRPSLARFALLGTRDRLGDAGEELGSAFRSAGRRRLSRDSGS